MVAGLQVNDEYWHAWFAVWGPCLFTGLSVFFELLFFKSDLWSCLDCFQNVMPLSAGLFKSERRNSIAQCPPRLHVQFLTPVLWSRVPNHFLKVGVLHFYHCGSNFPLSRMKRDVETGNVLFCHFLLRCQRQESMTDTVGRSNVMNLCSSCHCTYLRKTGGTPSAANIHRQTNLLSSLCFLHRACSCWLGRWISWSCQSSGSY